MSRNKMRKLPGSDKSDQHKKKTAARIHAKATGTMVKPEKGKTPTKIETDSPPGGPNTPGAGGAQRHAKLGKRGGY